MKIDVHLVIEVYLNPLSMAERVKSGGLPKGDWIASVKWRPGQYGTGATMQEALQDFLVRLAAKMGGAPSP